MTYGVAIRTMQKMTNDYFLHVIKWFSTSEERKNYMKNNMLQEFKKNYVCSFLIKDDNGGKNAENAENIQR